MPRLQLAARDYGNVRTKKFFAEALKADMARYRGKRAEQLGAASSGHPL